MAIHVAVFREPYMNCIFAGAYLMALQMHFLVRCVCVFLSRRVGHRYFAVFEWVMKTEYQGRGIPHWRIAAWIICFWYHELAARTDCGQLWLRPFSSSWICPSAAISMYPLGMGALTTSAGMWRRSSSSVSVRWCSTLIN